MATKIGKFKESNEQLSAQRTQYIFINSNFQFIK